MSDNLSHYPTVHLHCLRFKAGMNVLMVNSVRFPPTGADIIAHLLEFCYILNSTFIVRCLSSIIQMINEAIWIPPLDSFLLNMIGPQ